jgi:hypothetical protein
MALDRHSCELKLARDARYARRRRKLQTAGETRPCLHKIADHQHGTHACYVLDVCRCLPCKLANREYENTRARKHLYGRFDGLIDAEPTRQHVLALQAAGIGLKQITRLGGPSSGVMNKLMYGHPNADGTRRPPARRIKPETAQRILAIPISPETMAGGQCVPSIGTHRRLQALVAIGWSQSKLADRLGLERGNFGGMMQRDSVQLTTHRAVAALYEQLWNTLPPRDTHRDKIAYSRSIGYAKQHNWLPPLAWDDDELDDPTARADIELPPVTIDEIAVHRIMNGSLRVPLRSRSPERIEAIRQLADQGLNDSQIGQRVGLPGNSISQVRRRHDIPAAMPSGRTV